MILIRPKTADTIVSNIVEAAPATYSGVATYAQGAQVKVANDEVFDVYTSLAAGNTGHDPADNPDWWEASGSIYPEYDAGVTYAEGDRVQDSTSHRVYESFAAANIGHALTDVVWWGDVGPTNAYAMLDNYNGTTTVHPHRIDITQTFSGRIDSLALLNLKNAVSARIKMSTIEDGVVYDQVFSLVSTDGISDWFTYFFEDVRRKGTLAVTGLPTYVDPTIHVVIEGNGSTPVEAGLLSIGLSKFLGVTDRDGAEIGIRDYSRKDVDDFGNYTIIERAFSKRGNFRCILPNSAVDGVIDTLADYRSVPAVYIASKSFGASLLFGFYRDFNVELAYPTESICSLELEGLT
jgi:hypothetical protein